MSKKKKTTIYRISIDTQNTSGIVFQISKKVFEQHLKNYEKEIKENHKTYKEGDEWYLNDIRIETKDKDPMIITTYFIEDGLTTILLWKAECKPGYHFN